MYNAWIHEPPRKMQTVGFPLVARHRSSSCSFHTRSECCNHSHSRRYHYCILHLGYYIRHCCNHRFLASCTFVEGMLASAIDIHLKNSSCPVERIGFPVYSHFTQLDLILEKDVQSIGKLTLHSNILLRSA